MRKLYVATLVALVCCMALTVTTVSITAQNATGLIFDDPNYKNVERLGAGMNFTSDEKPQYSLKKYCPTPLSQGRIGSCVGWATGYAALTISSAYQKGISDQSKINSMAHSAMYIYNQIKVGGCDAGSRINEALDLLQDKGDCLASDFNPVDDCSVAPPSEIHRKALPYRIKDYGTLFSINAADDVKVGATISSLAEGKPVIIGMVTTASFLQLRGNTWQPSANESNGGGHAMTVVGYDKMRKVFEVMNSWGTDWGNGGFFYISFDDYAKYVKYGFQILVQPNARPSDPVQLEGEFVFKKYARYDEDNDAYIFNDMSPTLKQNRDASQYYTLADGAIKKDDYFRIVAQNMKKDSYVYVFSIKPDGSEEILFPSKDATDFDGTTIKPLPRVINNTASVMIPDGDNGMTVDQTGTDYLCILYSDKKIDDMASKVRTVRDASGSFNARLAAGFGNDLMKSSELNYSDGIMKINARSTSGAYIAPLVFKVEVK